MAWNVPAAAAVGRTSPGALKAGETYLATVKGTINAGGGVVSDAECSATTADRVWRLNRSLLPTKPGADHLDVLFNRDDRSGAAAAGTDGKCDTATHTYSYVLRPSRTRPINVRVDDPTPRGNVGALSVRIQRMTTETIVVNSAWTVPVRTARSYPARVPLRITASGSFSAGTGVTADAECSRTTTDATWRPWRSDWRDSTGRLLGDMTIDGRVVSWSPVSGSGRCDPTHRYRFTRAPSTTGRVGLQIADNSPANNSGRVTVTVGLA
jgi:hypothetical protein